MPDYPQLDWEQMYSQGVAPWNDPAPWPPLEGLVIENAAPGSKILEIGCGYGSDAVSLDRIGYKVFATDLSETAIARAQETWAHSGVEFRVEDALNHADETRYDLVYDKGVMLNFANIAERQRFAGSLRARLTPDGRWITVLGNVDNLNRDETGPDKRGYPRLSLLETVQAVEPDFEILSVTQEQFGSLADNSFMAWTVVSRPRRLPIEQVLRELPARRQPD